MRDPNCKSLSSARALGDKERADEGDLQGNQYNRSNNVHEGGLEGSTLGRGVKVGIADCLERGSPSGRTEIFSPKKWGWRATTSD